MNSRFPKTKQVVFPLFGSGLCFDKDPIFTFVGMQKKTEHNAVLVGRRRRANLIPTAQDSVGETADSRVCWLRGKKI